MDNSNPHFAEFISIWMTFPPKLSKLSSVFIIRPDQSSLSVLTKQKVIYKSFLGGIRMALENQMDSSQNLIPTLPLKAEQILTFLIEIKEWGLISLFPELQSDPVLGQEPSQDLNQKWTYVLEKMGKPFKSSLHPIQSSFLDYSPKDQSSALQLRLKNRITQEISVLPTSRKQNSIKIDFDPFKSGLYQILENGSSVSNTDYYHLTPQEKFSIYGIIQINQASHFFNAKPQDKVLEIKFNPINNN